MLIPVNLWAKRAGFLPFVHVMQQSQEVCYVRTNLGLPCGTWGSHHLHEVSHTCWRVGSSVYSLHDSVLELHREKCCLEHLFAQNRANLDHLLKEVTVSGKQQRGLLYINAYVSHWVSPHRHTRPGFLRVRWRVFCMHLAHVLRITDSFLAMVYLLPPVLKSAR
jgi:hypothetical protein